ncbi:sensor histidine kinase [Streptomyces sp. NA02950]|uniref:sensor histidine kinase n=1 Tax=Streptomyces sp. NA02950 TaxID=2742137 RepID=UPI00159093B3|nr:sensor histidine kinase [Streptomyces sp. NA02950]QKV97049.1 sensor histidine kinase [Streptomyces sp. NA02950]
MSTSLERRYTHRIEEFAHRRPFFVDLMTALVLWGCASLGGTLSMPETDPPDQPGTAILLAGLSCLVLLKHRSHPRTTAAVATVCTAAEVALGYLPTPLLLAPTIAGLYWLGTLADPRTTRAYAVSTMVALAAAAAFSDSTPHTPLVFRAINPVFWVLLPLAASSMARTRRAYLQAVQARAEHAERTREEEARLRVTEERMRIARELHDVVAHHLALANAQAGAAAHLALDNPQQTKKILTDLTGTTSSALRELKATLGLLRQTDEHEPTPPEPTPGLARLPELISVCESAGLTVAVTTEGGARTLSPGVDLTAFRIVQEALTNVTKHAAAHAVHVRFVYSGSQLLISVSDDGPTVASVPKATQGGGFGIMGMRERAHSVGGELRAGPRPEGGYQVTTSLPLTPHAVEGNGTP